MRGSMSAVAALVLAAAPSVAIAQQAAPPPEPPRSGSAEAGVTARGLDELIQQVKGDKHLSRLLAALILCKGLGQVQPDGTVQYRIVVSGGKAAVNGVDVTTLMAR